MILVNGMISQTVTALDRGLNYGDGVFRTFAKREGKLECWSAQYEKLASDCRRLRISPPEQNLLQDECGRVSDGLRQCVIKIIITRGQGRRGYAFLEVVQPTRIVMALPLPTYPAEYWRDGVKVRICNLMLAPQPALAGIKHLNRLENVLARAEWDDPDIVEGILCDSQGNAIEGIMSNLFMVSDGILTTPDLTCYGVAGVTRDRILDWARRSGFPTHIRDISLDEITSAEEVLFCNSVIGVWPVRELAGRYWESFEITRRIQNHLSQRDA